MAPGKGLLPRLMTAAGWAEVATSVTLGATDRAWARPLGRRLRLSAEGTRTPADEGGGRARRATAPTRLHADGDAAAPDAHADRVTVRKLEGRAVCLPAHVVELDAEQLPIRHQPRDTGPGDRLRMKWRSLACLVLLLAVPAAADLAPKRASDIVHLYASGSGACPLGVSPATWFDTRLLPDATIAPFQVPAKRSLVVRRIDVGASGGSLVPGAQFLVTVLGGVPGAGAIYATRSVVVDASSAVRLQIEFPLGFVVPDGGAVCLTNTGGAIFGGHVEGYLAPAK